MAWVSVPYYVVKQRGNGERKGYWQPTNAMIALGARLVPCGADGPEAWAIAAKAYAEWKAGKKKGRCVERAPLSRGNGRRRLRGISNERGLDRQEPEDARGLAARLEIYRARIR